MNFCQLVASSVNQNASDLHLSVGHLPIFRIDGQLIHYGDEVITSDWFKTHVIATLTNQQQQQLIYCKEFDYTFTTKQGYRLRGNIFCQRHGLSAVYRHIPAFIPPLTELNAPLVLQEFAGYTSGLILITGATGSGKSTTLAALIQFINQHYTRHIITLEDPIEFLHCSVQSLIQQRQIGTDTASFSDGLHAVLRQDPDLIMLGELRDHQTIRQALTAAETGHLVLASLHTRSAVQSVERIIDVFTPQDKPFIRSMLAGSLRMVLTQRLLPKKGGGRIAAYESLVNTPAIANLIREGKTHQILSILETNRLAGMQTMSQAIQNYIEYEIIDPVLVN